MSARHTVLAGIAGALLLAAGTGSVAAPARAGDGETAARAGAFLESQLAAGGHVLDYPGTDQADYGVTIDAVLALAASGTGPSEAAAATGQVETHARDYLGPAFGKTELYAGPVAKTALLAMTMGEDSRAFAGRDLIGDLAGLRTPAGRYADRTAYTDTSNTFTQGLALTALVRVGERPPPSGVDFLLAQQCGDGGFKMFVEAAGCTSDPDATSMAAIALLAVGDPAAEEGLDFLAGHLDADGGIGGGVGTEKANSNSTGLAAMAFADGRRAADLERARAFLAGLQLGCTAPADARGAIAYDADAYAALVAAGPDAQVSDQERRATSQAAFGFSGASLLTVSIEGATPGSDGCAGGPSTPPPTSSSPPTGPPTTPAGTPTVTTTTTLTETATVTAPAPPPETITVTAPDEESGDTADTPSSRTTTAPAATNPPPSSSPPSTSPRTPPASDGAPPPATSTAAILADGAAPAVTDPSGRRLPYLVAGGLVLLGAAAAAYILTRGRI